MIAQELAGLLLTARQGGSAVPPEATLITQAEAYAVQRLVMAQLGRIGGWKVGAAGPDAPPSCAPLPETGVFDAPHSFDAQAFTQREIESEICFRLATNLPPRAAPYTRADILTAIGTCHPGLEILQSRLTDPASASPLALLADFIQHGAYAVGKPIAGWRQIDFATLPVMQAIERAGEMRAAGNPAGDMIRLIVWLANEGAVWAGGLQAGQIVTCGSWTGKTAAPPNAQVTATFAGCPPVSIRFEAPRGATLGTP